MPPLAPASPTLRPPTFLAMTWYVLTDWFHPAAHTLRKVAIFLTGISGVNQLQTVTPSEMLRLNTNIPPTKRGKQDPLGVFGGDNAGFPNGRRPGDDVVDIALLSVMGRACHLGLGLCDPGLSRREREGAPSF